jgi:hypothetical protein
MWSLLHSLSSPAAAAADLPSRCQRATQPHRAEAPRSGAYSAHVDIRGLAATRLGDVDCHQEVIESSSPVTLNSAVFRGTVILAGKSRRAPAIFSASRDALLLASWPAISNMKAPVTALLGLTSAMTRSGSLISLLTTDIAFLYVKPEPSLTVSATAAYRGGGEAYLFYARPAHQRFASSSCWCS